MDRDRDARDAAQSSQVAGPTSRDSEGKAERRKALVEEIRGNNLLMTQLAESEEYFREGGEGVDWDDLVARSRSPQVRDAL